MFRSLAEPHLYGSLSIANPQRLLLLEEQLRAHPERSRTVKAAWWSSVFSCSVELGALLGAHPPIHLPQIEHVAWFTGFDVQGRTGPVGSHFALRTQVSETNAYAVAAASQTPRKTFRELIPCALLDKSSVKQVTNPPLREIWAMHIVGPFLQHWIGRLTLSIPSITHVTVTLYPWHPHGDDEDVLRILLLNERLQSLVVRDARGEGRQGYQGRQGETNRWAVWDAILARLNDDRLRVERPPRFDGWDLRADKIAEQFTRQQWEDAVYDRGTLGPWSTR